MAKSKTKTKKKPTGRPSKYSSIYVPKLANLMARNGMIDKDMAKFLGVAESTFHKWKNDHPEFAEALTKGKEEPDDKVEAALFRNAIGFAEDEITQDRKPDPNNPGQEIVIRTHLNRRYIAPSVAAQIFWLKNRRPDRWKDKQDFNVEFESDPLAQFAEGLRAFRLDKDSTS